MPSNASEINFKFLTKLHCEENLELRARGIAMVQLTKGLAGGPVSLDLIKTK